MTKPCYEKGTSLMKVLSDYVVLDLETTGLDPRSCEIIEIGAVRVVNHAVTERFSALVHPETPISPFITSLTGITNAMVAHERSVAEVLPEFLAFAGNAVVVGHNVNFDLGFLCENSLRLTGRSFTNDYIDTLRLSRRLFPNEHHHKLSDLEQRFGLHNESAHRALSDVLLTQECYEILSALGREQGILQG